MELRLSARGHAPLVAYADLAEFEHMCLSITTDIVVYRHVYCTQSTF